ncbi:cobalt-precorrin 5A hydrolase [Vibrio nitrifigilis]|uniref:Cobalt-precorrin 5A hydrolase n=1 Tax=Vibrio nitrifigilis TaxID=2789781 RepID=A0ABS0GJF1_9VIBR|nr:cobalt-precorrin 5A hydrolase [Vibrio nitrifigilis]MBF9002594.1 cobalt-precorrin 5A hydrolase [Vibrio nitrifigilis]
MSIVDPARVSLFSITPGGQVLANKIHALWPVTCYCAEKYQKDHFRAFEGSFANSLRQAFSRDEAIIVIGACGIVVRTIAPLVQDKLHDPAVLVMDEKAQHVISLLSGHIGGANQLACQLAARVGATPVITTATDVNQVCAIDVLAKRVNGTIEHFRDAIKTLNQALVSGESVGLYCDPDTLELTGIDLANEDTRGIELLSLEQLERHDCQYVIELSMKPDVHNWHAETFHLVPRCIVVGMGCRKDLQPHLMTQTFSALLDAHHWHPLAVTQFASIDVKRNETAMLNLAEQYQAPIEFFSANELSASGWRGPESEFVRKTVGVGAVSQPAAWLLSQGNLIGETVKQQGMTFTFGVQKICYTS